MTFRIQNEKLFHLPAYLWDCIFLSLKTFLLLLNIYLFIYLFGCPGSWLWHMGLRSLTKVEPRPPALEAHRGSHWTMREVLGLQFY